MVMRGKIELLFLWIWQIIWHDISLHKKQALRLGLHNPLFTNLSNFLYMFYLYYLPLWEHLVLHVFVSVVETVKYGEIMIQAQVSKTPHFLLTSPAPQLCSIWFDSLPCVWKRWSQYCWSPCHDPQTFRCPVLAWNDAIWGAFHRVGSRGWLLGLGTILA